VFLLRGSLAAELQVLNIVQMGNARLAELAVSDMTRIRELLAKYHDLPMDLVDAALVRVVERERIRTIFTLDRRDLGIYRPAQIGRFQIVP
jgi:hypothetical protein